jgi:Domain of unknown function (DUF4384)/LPP20 lipoprotein
MFINVIKVAILAVFCLITACTSSSRIEPEPSELPALTVGQQKVLIEKARHQYPSSLYLLGIGQGQSEKAAAELARADLIKQIRVEMRVTWSDFIRERGGTTEQEVSRFVETNVAEFVRGIEIVEQARDAGTSYAVAILPKAEVWRILERAKAKEEVLSAPLEPSEPKEGIWVEAEGIASLAEDTTVAEAKARSRDEARRKAIEQAVGIFVKGQTLAYNSQIADDLVRSIARGLIVEEQVKEEGLREIGQGTGQKVFQYATKLRAKVKPIRPEQRGDFAVRAILNKTMLSQGEEMQIKAVVTKDAYLHIFNVGQDDKVTVLLPSRYARANFVSAQKEFLFPDDEQRNLGIRLKAFAPIGAKKALEKIKLIATTKPIDLAEGKIPEGAFKVYEGKDTALVTDLLKTLSLLDDSEWTEVTIPYEIRR